MLTNTFVSYLQPMSLIIVILHATIHLVPFNDMYQKWKQQRWGNNSEQTMWKNKHPCPTWTINRCGLLLKEPGAVTPLWPCPLRRQELSFSESPSRIEIAASRCLLTVQDLSAALSNAAQRLLHWWRLICYLWQGKRSPVVAQTPLRSDKISLFLSSVTFFLFLPCECFCP
jgi:hypothetical protein